MAAAYAFHIVKNRPFVDGNKRIAAVAMGTFLEANGALLRVDEVERYDVVIALASGGLGKSELASWLRARAKLPGEE